MSAARKTHVDGTHRTRTPAETFAAIAPKMARFGISRLANVTGLDSIGVPVYVAIRPASRSLVTSQGKGLDPMSAKVSALMESIETWHGENIDRPVRRASHAALSRSGRALDPKSLPGGAGLSRDLEIDWIEGVDRLSEGPVWVPFEAVTMSCVLAPGERHHLVPTSNGLASGNHPLEAMTHGLCEVIERDAVTRWRLAGGSAAGRGKIDLATVKDTSCAEVIRRVAAAGVGIAAFDVTSSLGIPTYAVEIFDGGADPASWRTGAFGGFGTHLAPEIALLRALTEAVQSRLTFISGSRDDLFRERYSAPKSQLAAHAARVLSARVEVDFAARRSLATGTFEEDVAVLTGALRGAGAPAVAVVDLTRGDVGIPVVKVVVPGLHAGLGSSAVRDGSRKVQA